MVCILPTTDELDAALARAHAAYAAQLPSARVELPADFESWCRDYIRLGAGAGPRISAAVIGTPDATLLADGFDFAMQQHGLSTRARRAGL